MRQTSMIIVQCEKKCKLGIYFNILCTQSINFTIVADMNTLHLFSSHTMRGIIRIFNLQTEKTLLLKSENLTKDIQKIRFDLDLGNFPNRELQEEYEEHGLEIYTIDPLLIAENNEDLDKLLQQGEQKLEELDIPFYRY